MKTGDKVRVTEKSTGEIAPGSTGVIVNVEGDFWPYHVQLDKVTEEDFLFSEDEIEVI